ncbi:MAG: endonuclease/exonuclease/phosphatase family protein [Anaerolineae bacterium]|nr:endonuclease/exonuclease/phosphatase family protein [Anaerolineae bacterium]
MNERRWEVVTAVYLALMVFWFGLWLFTADRFWWLVMVNRIVPYLFVPALVLFVIFLVKQRWRLAIMAGLPLFIFVWLYRPYLLPERGEIGTAVLRVMSYNILFSNQSADGVTRVIQTYAPDLVALQEVQPRMMAELQERLATEYPYSLMGIRHEYGTTAVFSRYPFLDQQIVDLGDDRPATMVTVEVDGERVVFTAVHLRAYGLRWVPLRQIPQAIGERTRRQNRQAEILLAALAEQEGTVIVGCDCNSKESSSSYRMLAETLANAAHSRPNLSLPGASPDRNLQHIDYIFYRGNLRANGVYVIDDSGGSDHQPILAIFSFPDTRN